MMMPRFSETGTFLFNSGGPTNNVTRNEMMLMPFT